MPDEPDRVGGVRQDLERSGRQFENVGAASGSTIAAARVGVGVGVVDGLPEGAHPVARVDFDGLGCHVDGVGERAKAYRREGQQEETADQAPMNTMCARRPQEGSGSEHLDRVCTGVTGQQSTICIRLRLNAPLAFERTFSTR